MLAKQRGHTGYLTFATCISADALPPLTKRPKQGGVLMNDGAVIGATGGQLAA